MKKKNTYKNVICLTLIILCSVMIALLIVKLADPTFLDYKKGEKIEFELPSAERYKDD